MGKLPKLDSLLHSELRLAVMTLLLSLESAEFSYLKEETGATSGNLSVQLDKLEKAGYIEIQKSFRGKKPLTTCKITKKGTKAFEDYIEALKPYLGTQKHPNNYE
jgi:DNA-binding MarR family transcriptional regulator